MSPIKRTTSSDSVTSSAASDASFRYTLARKGIQLCSTRSRRTNARQAPVESIRGIGPVTGMKLRAANITTASGLRTKASRLGKAAFKCWFTEEAGLSSALANRIYVSFNVTRKVKKSVQEPTYISDNNTSPRKDVQLNLTHEAGQTSENDSNADIPEEASSVLSILDTTPADVAEAAETTGTVITGENAMAVDVVEEEEAEVAGNVSILTAVNEAMDVTAARDEAMDVCAAGEGTLNVTDTSVMTKDVATTSENKMDAEVNGQRTEDQQFVRNIAIQLKRVKSAKDYSRVHW